MPESKNYSRSSRTSIVEETNTRGLLFEDETGSKTNTFCHIAHNLLKLKISSQNSDGSVITDEEYQSQRKYLLSEKEAMLENLNKTDERIDAWHELSAKTFNFACYARYWFAHGDFKTKTQILGALGSNLTIIDKKVAIDGFKHFFLIEKGKKDIVELARKFEPEKWLDILGRIDVVDALKPAWLTLLDNVGTYFSRISPIPVYN